MLLLYLNTFKKILFNISTTFVLFKKKYKRSRYIKKYKRSRYIKNNTFKKILFFEKYLYMLFPFISSLFFASVHTEKRQKSIYYNYTEERFRLDEKIKGYERLFDINN
jgi:hypothetical protein